MFLPPEMLVTKQPMATPAGDIYAVGCALYYVLVGRMNPLSVFLNDHARQAKSEAEKDDDRLRREIEERGGDPDDRAELREARDKHKRTVKITVSDFQQAFTNPERGVTAQMDQIVSAVTAKNLLPMVGSEDQLAKKWDSSWIGFHGASVDEPGLFQLVNEMLSPDHHARPTASECLRRFGKILNRDFLADAHRMEPVHPYFKDHGYTFRSPG